MQKCTVKPPKEAYLILLVGYFCAVISVFLTPPLNVLDGQAHWHKLVQVSQFEFVPKKISENYYGGDLDWPAFRFGQLAGEAFSNSDPVDANEFRTWAWMLNQDKSVARVEQVFSPSAIYPPLAYLPSALSLKSARGAGFDILDQYFIASIANAAAFFGLIALALRLLPGLHIAVAAFSTAPSLLFMAGSVSADPLNFAIPVVFLAYCWHLHETQSQLKMRQLILLGGGMLALAMLKPTMLLFSAFALMTLQPSPVVDGFGIFQRIARTAGQWFYQNRLLFLSATPALLFWYLWNTSFEFHPGLYFGWDTDPDTIVQTLVAEPLRSFGFVFAKLFENPALLWSQSVTFAGGHSFGYAVAAPMIVAGTVGLAMLWSAVCEPASRRSSWIALLLLSLALVYGLGIYLGFWIMMTPPQSEGIAGVQPRYFWLVWVLLTASLAFFFGGSRRLTNLRPAIAIFVIAANVGAWALPLTHFSKLWNW